MALDRPGPKAGVRPLAARRIMMLSPSCPLHPETSGRLRTVDSEGTSGAGRAGDAIRVITP
jgi:hypothetical protein